MNSHLQWLLGQVNDWLKFAEAKNGALLVADVALVVGLWQLETPPSFLGVYSDWYFLALQVLLGAGAVVTSVSFLPVTEIPKLRPKGVPAATDNLLFFGHVAKYTGPYLLNALERQGLVSVERAPFDSQLAEQIVMNSRIASWKFACFKWGLWLSLGGLISPVLAIPLFGFLHLARIHGNRQQSGAGEIQGGR